MKFWIHSGKTYVLVYNIWSMYTEWSCTWVFRPLRKEKGLLADSDIEEDFEIELQEKDWCTIGFAQCGRELIGWILANYLEDPYPQWINQQTWHLDLASFQF